MSESSEYRKTTADGVSKARFDSSDNLAVVNSDRFHAQWYTSRDFDEIEEEISSHYGVSREDRDGGPVYHTHIDGMRFKAVDGGTDRKHLVVQADRADDVYEAYRLVSEDAESKTELKNFLEETTQSPL